MITITWSFIVNTCFFRKTTLNKIGFSKIPIKLLTIQIHIVIWYTCSDSIHLFHKKKRNSEYFISKSKNLKYFWRKDYKVNVYNNKLYYTHKKKNNHNDNSTTNVNDNCAAH